MPIPRDRTDSIADRRGAEEAEDSEGDRSSAGGNRGGSGGES